MDEARMSQLLLGFWPARALSTAAELGLLALLEAEGPLGGPAIAERLGLRSVGLADLLDALVGLQVLVRDGDRIALAPGVGTPDTSLLDLTGADAYRAWAELPDALRGRGPAGSIFDAVLRDPALLGDFVERMATVSAPARATLLDELELSGAATVCDLGGADGRLAIALAQRHPHLRCTTFDLAPVAELARHAVELAGIGDRVAVVAGDFFVDRLPASDVMVLSLVLLDWDADRKRALLRRVRDALAPGGRVVVVDRLDEPGQARPRSTFEALRALHLLVSIGDVFPFGEADLRGWLAEAGFVDTTTRPAGGGLVVTEARVPTL